MTNPDATIAAANERSRDEAKNVEAALRASYLERVFAGATLTDFTQEEQKYLDHAVLSRLRRAAYEATVAAMDTPDELHAWVDAMTNKFGATAIIHGHELGWLALLRVVRWGEEPAHWPATWEQGDFDRAREWLYENEHPAFLTYLIGPNRQHFTPKPGRRIAFA